LIVENSVFSVFPSKNTNSFPFPVPNIRPQMLDDQNILAVTTENASLYHPQVFYKTQLWGNLK
jgi:hypothetical protein